jgi:hypothetical protein
MNVCQRRHRQIDIPYTGGQEVPAVVVVMMRENEDRRREKEGVLASICHPRLGGLVFPILETGYDV